MTNPLDGKTLLESSQMNETNVWFGAGTYVLQTMRMPRVPDIPPEEDAQADDTAAFIYEQGFLCLFSV